MTAAAYIRKYNSNGFEFDAQNRYAQWKDEEIYAIVHRKLKQSDKLSEKH